MTLQPVSMAEAFPVPKFEPKPRGLHQTWLKDVGFDEAPHYVERMGLTELEDFLSVAGERLDYVKVATRQVIEHPEAWVRRKVELYQHFGVEPYLDDKRLVHVLDDWSPAFSGYHLYYPSRRHPSLAFVLLVEALRHHD